MDFMAQSKKAAQAEAAYQRLLRRTARMFYGVDVLLVMEALIHAPRQQADPSSGIERPELQLDESIADRLQLHPKQVRLLLAQLQQDRLVTSFRKEIKKEESQYGYARVAPPSSQDVQCYYGIDYEVAADAVRYKLHDIERQLDEERHAPTAATRSASAHLRQPVPHPSPVLPHPTHRCPDPQAQAARYADVLL